jgi:hypothetical protein
MSPQAEGIASLTLSAVEGQRRPGFFIASALIVRDPQGRPHARPHAPRRLPLPQDSDPRLGPDSRRPATASWPRPHAARMNAAAAVWPLFTDNE